MNKENEINNFKIIQDMLLYQKALYNFLNSNYIHNLVNLYFPGIKSYFSFISDSINYFKFKWCEFYSNSKNKNISINDFLYEIKLGDLLYFVNDFYKYIQDHIITLNIVINLLNQIKNLYQNSLNNEVLYNFITKKNNNINKIYFSNDNNINDSNNNINDLNNEIINNINDNIINSNEEITLIDLAIGSQISITPKFLFFIFNVAIEF